jgi:hypothetical protein
LSNFEQATSQSTMPLGCCANAVWALNISMSIEPNTACAIGTCPIIILLVCNKTPIWRNCLHAGLSHVNAADRQLRFLAGKIATPNDGISRRSLERRLRCSCSQGRRARAVVGDGLERAAPIETLHRRRLAHEMRRRQWFNTSPAFLDERMKDLGDTTAPIEE